MGEFEHVSQATLDRMVDGELSETEQRSLLQHLDETDEGWRQLALTYVEARTLGAELRSLAAPQNESLSTIPRGNVESAPKTSAGPRAPGWLTVVLTASVMLAAGLLAGMELGTGSPSDSVAGSPDGDVVAEAPSTTKGAPREQTPGRNGNGFPIAPSELNPETEFLEFVLNDELGGAQAVSIPIHTDGNPNSLLQSSGPALSRELQEFLHERGHKFVEQRDLISVQLPDGRHAVIPVREVQLTHMMNRFGQ